jgi:hypothetical protein
MSLPSKTTLGLLVYTISVGTATGSAGRDDVSRAGHIGPKKILESAPHPGFGGHMKNGIPAANGIFDGTGIGDVTGKLVYAQGAPVPENAAKNWPPDVLCQQLPDDGLAQKTARRR